MMYIYAYAFPDYQRRGTTHFHVFFSCCTRHAVRSVFLLSTQQFTHQLAASYVGTRMACGKLQSLSIGADDEGRSTTFLSKD